MHLLNASVRLTLLGGLLQVPVKHERQRGEQGRCSPRLREPRREEEMRTSGYQHAGCHAQGKAAPGMPAVSRLQLSLLRQQWCDGGE